MNGRNESDAYPEASTVGAETDSADRRDLLDRFANTDDPKLDLSKRTQDASEILAPEQTESTNNTPVDDRAVSEVLAKLLTVAEFELNETEYQVSPSRRVHILDGDATGGGHRAGTGRAGKSEFPQNWSDDKIIENIESIANDSAATRILGRNGATIVRGNRDNIDMEVILNKNRQIVTGYPTSVPRN